MNKISITKSDRPGFVVVTDLTTGHSELVEAKAADTTKARDIVVGTDEEELPGRYAYAP